MPNCTEEIGTNKIEFGRLGRRVVEGCFDGGSMTSDAGVMLLAATDRKLGLMQAAAGCIADPRSPLLIKHGVADMLRQRVYGLALGWEDLNDHGALRQDVAMQTAVGVDREVASAPTLCRLEKWADRATAWRLHELLVEQFIASFKTAPEELVLDFDATDNPLHGQQEGRFFHGYYDCYCYLPLYVFCGQQLLCAYLRPSRIDGAKHAGAILKLLVTRLRQKDLQNQHLRDVLGFVRWLQTALALSVEVEDERLTTRQANRLGVRGQDDAVAAMLILQSYLDKQKGKVDERAS